MNHTSGILSFLARVRSRRAHLIAVALVCGAWGCADNAEAPKARSMEERLASIDKIKGNASSGSDVYVSACARCHGPAPRELASPTARWELEVDSKVLYAQVLGGGRRMPSLGTLSDTEIGNLGAFVRAIRDGLELQRRRLVISELSSDSAAGKLVYDAQCARCHGQSLPKGDAAHAIRQVLFGGRRMPSFASLGNQEIADVAAFVAAPQ